VCVCVFFCFVLFCFLPNLVKDDGSNIGFPGALIYLH
jgi:hypothetical protein